MLQLLFHLWKNPFSFNVNMLLYTLIIYYVIHHSRVQNITINVMLYDMFQNLILIYKVIIYNMYWSQIYFSAPSVSDGLYPLLKSTYRNYNYLYNHKDVQILPILIKLDLLTYQKPYFRLRNQHQQINRLRFVKQSDKQTISNLNTRQCRGKPVRQTRVYWLTS